MPATKALELLSRDNVNHLAGVSNGNLEGISPLSHLRIGQLETSNSG
jgi:hypothetical protein